MPAHCWRRSPRRGRSPRGPARRMRFRHESARAASICPAIRTALPDAVLVREIAGGSFEEVTRRLGVLHALRELGIPVWNDARAIERCVDKSMTSFLLAKSGIPTPQSWAVEGLAAARALVDREAPAGRLVLKPLFGSQGRGLRLIAGAERAAGAGCRRWRLLSATICPSRRRRVSRSQVVRLRRSGDCGDEPPIGALDHQCSPRRPAAAARSGTRSHRTRPRRRCLRRRRLCRCRPDPRRDRSGPGARGQLDAGVEGAAAGDRARDPRSPRRPVARAPG